MRRRKHLKFDSLLRFLNSAQSELKRCERSKSYLAGTILMGAAVEFALTSLMHAWPHLVYRRGKKLKDYWDLKRLNDFAHTVGWLDYKAFLAAERIRKHRNLVHPNWFASKNPPRIAKGLFAARHKDLAEVWRSVNRWLFGDTAYNTCLKLFGPAE